MKKIKKKNKKIYIFIVAILIVLLLVLLLTINKKSEANKSPKELVKEYIEKYRKLDESVVEEIEYPFQDELSDIQKERYKGIVKFKYEQIEFSILDSEDTMINKTDAVITVNIRTIDINAAYKKASTYIESHKDEFTTKEDEIEYKLDTISKYQLKEEYNIMFNLYKKDGKWKIADLSKADLDKIKGLY